MTLKVSAPGKVVLIGEYAVLENAPALVTAVSRRVSVTEASVTSASPEVDAAIKLASHAFNTSIEGARIDASSLSIADQKLGLGSSSAAAVATVALLAAKAGLALDEHANRERIFELARQAHQSVAPSGSGIDVCASTFGGLLSFEQPAKKSYLSWPKHVFVVVVSTGKQARTSTFVDAVRAFKEAAPERHKTLFDLMRAASERGIASFKKHDSETLLKCIAQYHELMRQLGNEAGVEIITPELDAIHQLAVTHSGQAKASGAGGGDIAVAFFSRPDHAEHFRDSCKKNNFTVIDLEYAAEGVRIEQDSV